MTSTEFSTIKVSTDIGGTSVISVEPSRSTTPSATYGNTRTGVWHNQPETSGTYTITAPTARIQQLKREIDESNQVDADDFDTQTEYAAAQMSGRFAVQDLYNEIKGRKTARPHLTGGTHHPTEENHHDDQHPPRPQQ